MDIWPLATADSMFFKACFLYKLVPPGVLLDAPDLLLTVPFGEFLDTPSLLVVILLEESLDDCFLLLDPLDETLGDPCKLEQIIIFTNLNFKSMAKDFFVGFTSKN